MAEAPIGAVEEFPEGKPYRVDNAARCAASHVVSDEPDASCSKRSCGATTELRGGAPWNECEHGERAQDGVH